MRFTALFAVVAGVASYVAAQSNPITSPSGGTIQAGQQTTIQWTPSTGSTVTLVLRTGDANDLTTVATIASDIPNTGSYTWNVSPSLPNASDYTIEIIPSNDPANANYSPRFAVSGGSASSSASSGSSSPSSTSGSSMPSMTAASNSTSNSTSSTTSSSNSTAMTTKSTSTTTTAKTTATGSSTATGGATAPSSGAFTLKGSDAGLVGVVLGLAGLVALI